VTPPTDSLSLSGASGAFLSSGTLYFKSDAAGQFNLIDTVSDSGSGPASATFPALSATNWTTHSAETVSAPAGGPYTSTAFKWSATASTPATYTVTSKDNAGNSSAGSTLTFVSDTTAPTAGAVKVNGTAATGAGSFSTTVKVDSSTPSTPTLSFSGLSSNAFYSSGQNTLYFRPAAGGTYTVTASSTDSVSGIASYTFSSLSSNNFTGTQTGGEDA